MKTKTMVKISIPERLRDGMMLKQASYFEVPANQDGSALIEWWDKAASDSRDAIMKLAYDNNTDIIAALKEHLSKQG